MNYIERAINQIKTEWFPNHVAEIKGEEGNQVLYWRKEGTRAYFMKFILDGSDLIITGDVGKAIFSLTCLATLENIHSFDLDYLTRKLSAFSDERWDFDDKEARKELSEWYSNMNEDYDDALEDEFLSETKKEETIKTMKELRTLYNELVDTAKNCSSHRHYESAVSSIYYNTPFIRFDAEEASFVSGFGKRLPYRLISYWVALQMAYEYLESQKKENLESIQ